LIDILLGKTNGQAHGRAVIWCCNLSPSCGNGGQLLVDDSESWQSLGQHYRKESSLGIHDGRTNWQPELVLKVCRSCERTGLRLREEGRKEAHTYLLLCIVIVSNCLWNAAYYKLDCRLCFFKQEVRMLGPTKWSGELR